MSDLASSFGFGTNSTGSKILEKEGLSQNAFIQEGGLTSHVISEYPGVSFTNSSIFSSSFFNILSLHCDTKNRTSTKNDVVHQPSWSTIWSTGQKQWERYSESVNQNMNRRLGYLLSTSPFRSVARMNQKMRNFPKVVQIWRDKRGFSWNIVCSPWRLEGWESEILRWSIMLFSGRMTWGVSSEWSQYVEKDCVWPSLSGFASWVRSSKKDIWESVIQSREI